MNPSSKESPNLNLPPPVRPGEQGAAAPAAGPERTAGMPESPGAAAGPERAPGVAAGPPPAGPAIPMPQAAPLAAQTDDSSTTTAANSPVLDEPDLIEKEWVNKAKQIVEQTRHDPHRQSQELTVVKADYMKQRYDKTIKLNK